MKKIRYMQKLTRNMQALYGKEGLRWINALPQHLQQLEKKLSIKILQPYRDLSFNYVATAKTQDNKDIVIKYGMPHKNSRNEFNKEMTALKAFDGQSMLNLIDGNVDECWLLLEKCDPGIPLSTLKDDDEATRQAVYLMQKLWRPCSAEESFKSMNNWLAALKDKNAQNLIPSKFLSAAKFISIDLLKSMGESVLLHGDLHHNNILSSQREPWLAIDPKGVIGERECEVGAFIRNPYSLVATHSNLKSLFNRRLAIISELTSLDQQRLAHWSFVQTVLSAVWLTQDNCESLDNILHCSKILYLIIS